MRETCPVDTRNDPHQVSFDLDRILLASEPEALRESAHVGVDDDPLRTAPFSRDNVGCLPGDPWEAQEGVEVVRNLALVVLDDHLHRPAERSGLLPVEARGE